MVVSLEMYKGKSKVVHFPCNSTTYVKFNNNLYTVLLFVS